MQVKFPEGCLQLLEVKCKQGSDADVKYYVKGPKGWRVRGRGKAFIGKNGCGKEREGDARTPLGDLRALRAFGILPDPGSSLPYLNVRPGIIACDEEGPYYNRIVECAGWDNIAGSCDIGGERMWELSPEYDYGLETDYNAAGLWPLGSAIFIHCKGAKQWTGGCVALDKPLMKKILMTATEALVIRISQ